MFDEATAAFPTLAALSEQRKFTKITKILKNREVNLALWLGCANASKDDKEPALHVLVASRPPLLLVDLMIQKLNAVQPGHVPEGAVNDSSETPLHIAIRTGCDFNVWERLAYSELPMITMDDVGRYPLHWVCALKKLPRGLKKEQIVEFVNRLIKIYPQASIIPDVYGKTPLDLAVRSKNGGERVRVAIQTVQNIVTKTAGIMKCGLTAASSAPSKIIEIPQHIQSGDIDETGSFSSVGSSVVGAAQKNRQQQELEQQRRKPKKESCLEEECQFSI